MKKNNTQFTVIGIDDNQSPLLPSALGQVVASGKVFSGGARHHEIVKDLLPREYQWINITVPIEALFEKYDNYRHVIIFASGDPLFFGFANTIRRLRPEAQLQVYPFFNSLQLLAHRLLLPYQDMHIVSLTGRPWDKFDEALIRGESLVGILTDNKLHTPQTIAERMLDYGFDNYQMAVGELLGNNQKEHFRWYHLQEVVSGDFLFPNNIIIKKLFNRPRPMGIPERDFHLLNGRVKMITKMPIRLLSLSMLDLREKHVFWDVGFCTGSVSIEAKMQFPHLSIYAFECRPEGESLMMQNTRKFGTPGINYFIEDFLHQDLSDLPAPDAVFIGGHGGKLIEMVEIITSHLSKNGVIVFNSVSETSRNLFLEAIQKYNLVLEQDTHIVLDDFNPIDVMKARKK